MSQHQINTVLNWERRLEIEDEQRHNHVYSSYINNNLARVQDCREARKSILARIADLFRGRQPGGRQPGKRQAAPQNTYRAYEQEQQGCCKETQPSA